MTDFSSPKCSATLKLTASPRVFFGRSATFMPLASVKRCVRASRLAGVGIEGLAGRGRHVALVVLDERRDVDLRRHGCAIGLRIGNELADRHVRALEIVERHALHGLRRDGAVGVALEEEEPPVAERDRLGDRHAERLRIVDRLLEVLRGLGAHAGDLGLGDRILRHIGQRGEHRVAHRLDGSASGTWAKNVMLPGAACAWVHDCTDVALLVSTSALYRRPAGASVITSPSTSVAT